MALPVEVSTGNILRIINYFWCAPRVQLGLNVLHYQVESIAGGSPRTFQFDDVALAAKTHFAGLCPDLVNESCYFLGTTVQVVYPTTSLLGFVETVALPGTLEQEMLPAQVAGFIRTRTDQPGRRGLGRTYVPFPTEGFNDTTGSPTAGYIALIQAYADGIAALVSLSDGLETMTTQFGIFSNGNAFYEFSTVIAQGKWATQRRRGMFGSINELPEWVPLPLP